MGVVEFESDIPRPTVQTFTARTEEHLSKRIKIEIVAIVVLVSLTIGVLFYTYGNQPTFVERDLIPPSLRK
jgi:hypothetical protein